MISQDSNDIITLPVPDGYATLRHSEIICCRVVGAAVVIHRTGNPPIQVNRSLRALEEALSGSAFFFRVHNSCLVNLHHLQHWNRRGDHALVLSDGSAVQVARARRKALLKRLNVI